MNVTGEVDPESGDIHTVIISGGGKETEIITTKPEKGEEIGYLKEYVKRYPERKTEVNQLNKIEITENDGNVESKQIVRLDNNEIGTNEDVTVEVMRTVKDDEGRLVKEQNMVIHYTTKKDFLEGKPADSINVTVKEYGENQKLKRKLKKESHYSLDEQNNEIYIQNVEEDVLDKPVRREQTRLDPEQMVLETDRIDIEAFDFIKNAGRYELTDKEKIAVENMQKRLESKGNEKQGESK